MAFWKFGCHFFRFGYTHVCPCEYENENKKRSTFNRIVFKIIFWCGIAKKRRLSHALLVHAYHVACTCELFKLLVRRSTHFDSSIGCPHSVNCLVSIHSRLECVHSQNQLYESDWFLVVLVCDIYCLQSYSNWFDWFLFETRNETTRKRWTRIGWMCKFNFFAL